MHSRDAFWAELKIISVTEIWAELKIIFVTETIFCGGK
jgi:hypothetical protein